MSFFSSPVVCNYSQNFPPSAERGKWCRLFWSVEEERTDMLMADPDPGCHVLLNRLCALFVEMLLLEMESKLGLRRADSQPGRGTEHVLGP